MISAITSPKRAPGRPRAVVTAGSSGYRPGRRRGARAGRGPTQKLVVVAEGAGTTATVEELAGRAAGGRGERRIWGPRDGAGGGGGSGKPRCVREPDILVNSAESTCARRWRSWARRCGDTTMDLNLEAPYLPGPAFGPGRAEAVASGRIITHLPEATGRPCRAEPYGVSKGVESWPARRPSVVAAAY